jgi:hypothetical protein
MRRPQDEGRHVRGWFVNAPRSVLGMQDRQTRRDTFAGGLSRSSSDNALGMADRLAVRHLLAEQMAALILSSRDNK